jgi:hypothetical protein
VFEARLPPENRGDGIAAAHADAFEQPDRRPVPRIGDGDDFRHGRMVEDEADGFPHRLGPQANALSRGAQRESDLRGLSISGDADSDVP